MNIGGFYVGQKVICVDGRFHAGVCDWCSSLPKAREIYTIRRIQFGSDVYTKDSGLGLVLKELRNPPGPNGCEAGFFHDRFRPLPEVVEQREAMQRRQLSLDGEVRRGGGCDIGAAAPFADRIQKLNGSKTLRDNMFFESRCH